MRKRVLSILLSVAMVLSLLPTAVFADEVDGTEGTGETGTAAFATGECGADGSSVTWTLTENENVPGTYTLTISAKEGAETANMADFTNPTDPATGVSVAPWYTALAALADSENHTVPITEVVVEDGVTGLGNWAFAYTQVTEAKFTSSVTRYGIRIYSNCAELTTVNWNGFEPTEVKLAEGDDGYFNGCALPSNIFDSDSKLNTCIVGGTTYVDTVAVPAEVVAVGTSGFYGTAFRTVDFENNLPNVKQIGYYSFANMQNLESLTVPGYMKFVLGGKNNNLSNAFAEEFSATSLVVGEGMKVLPASVAREWRSMQTLRLPSTLTDIGNSAFANAKQLHSVDMSKIVGPITVDISFNTYKSASGEFPVDCIFYVNNSDVQSTLANDNWGNRNNNNSSSSRVIYAVTDGGTFSDETVFTAGTLAAPTKLDSLFKGWFDKNGNEVTDENPAKAGNTYYAKWDDAQLSGNCGAVDSSGNFGSNAKWNLTPNGNGYTLTIYGSGKMADFKGNITKPDSTQPWNVSKTGVPYSAITAVTVAPQVTNIGKYAFNGLGSVETYNIATTVTDIATWGIDTESAKTFNIGSSKSFTLVDGVLMTADKATLIAYPGGADAVAEYVIPSTVTNVVGGAFVGCDAQKVVIPETVTYFPAWSFSASTTEEIVFNASMTEIVSGMFVGLPELKTLDLGTRLTKIGEGASYNLPNVKELVIPASVTSIGAQAFKNLTGAGGTEKVTFAGNLPDMENSPFLRQNRLTTVDLSNSTTFGTINWSFFGAESVAAYYFDTQEHAEMLTRKSINKTKAIFAVLNGGSIPADKGYYDDCHDDAGSLVLVTPKKDGYDFKGWYTTADFSGEAVETFTAGETYYAKWVKAEPGDLKPDFSAYTVRVEHTDRTGRKEYALDTEGGFTEIGREGNAISGFTYSITVDPAVFIALYNADKTDGNHVKTSGSTSMTLTWMWENGAWKPVADSKVQATIKVKHEIPVFLFFKTVDSNGDPAKLTAADLARAGLQKDRLNGDDWYCYVKLTSNAALPTVRGTTYTDKNAAPFSTVLAELAAADTTAERHDDSKNFTLGDKIVWTDLNYNPSTHGGWNSYSIGYHMDGTLTVYNVTFNANGGTVSADVSGYYVKGADLTFPTPVREGYTFTGWDLGGFRYTSEDDHTVPVTGDWTFVAQWEANTYKVTFDANGGEGTMDAQTFTYDVAQNLTANAFTRTGYNFAGWNTKSDGTGEKYSDGQTVKNLTAVNDGNVNLYAQWEVRVPVDSAKFTPDTLADATYDADYTSAKITAVRTDDSALTADDGCTIVLLDAKGNVVTDGKLGLGLTYKDGTVSGKPTAAGSVSFKLRLVNAAGSTVCEQAYTITVNKAAIASVDLDVAAPAVGNKPQDTVTAGTGYTASISWSPAHDPFDFNTAYTATVTLTPDENHSFDGTQFRDGWTLDGLDETTGAVKLKKTFDKTDMDTVKTPVIDPNGGFFTGGTTVRITCATEGAIIHYTTDGTTPTANSPVYTGPLNIYQTLTVKAIAVKDEFYDSAVASAEFTLFAPVDPSTCTLIFSTNGGSVIPNVTAPKGTVISLAGYVPTKTGYTFGGWYLDAALTQPVAEVTLTGTTTVYAKWTEDVQANFPFTDVKTGDWFYEGVDYVWANGLMNGVSADTFDPYANTTRGMIVTVLARMEGVNTAGTPWYAAGRQWAMANGVSDGTNMETEITREQLATMLYRCAQLKGYDVSATVELISFTDADQVSGWAEDAMKWAVANGLIKGRSDALAPKDKATRGEVATVLMRFRETVGK